MHGPVALTAYEVKVILVAMPLCTLLGTVVSLSGPVSVHVPPVTVIVTGVAFVTPPGPVQESP